MERTIYEALPGVEWVNGKPVPKNRLIALSEVEARFDRDMGRIKPRITRRSRKSSGQKRKD